MLSSFKLFRHRFIRIILISNLFSQIGIWVRNFAILLYVMDKTEGNALYVSLVSVAEYAPMFIFSFIGGVFADRWKPRKTLVWCDFLSAASVGIVWLALLSGLWEAVLLTTLISSVLSQFSQPAGMKWFKIHVPDELAQPAMSLLQTLFAVFMVLGPVLGTGVYQTFGIQAAIGMTGISFLMSAAVLLFLPPDRPGSGQEAAASLSVIRDMKAGIRYVAGRKTLLLLSLCFLLVGLGVGLISPLSVFVVTEKLALPASDLKWLSIPYGLGEIVGGIVTFAVASRIAPSRLLVLGLLVNAAGMILTGLSGMLWIAMLAQLVIALLQPAIFIGNQTLVMQHTEAEYIGRVTGIRTPLMTGAMLLMMGLAGVLKNMFPLEWIYGFAGLCLAAGCLAVLPLLRIHGDAGGTEEAV